MLITCSQEDLKDCSTKIQSLWGKIKTLTQQTYDFRFQRITDQLLDLLQSFVSHPFLQDKASKLYQLGFDCELSTCYKF